MEPILMGLCPGLHRHTFKCQPGLLKMSSPSLDYSSWHLTAHIATSKRILADWQHSLLKRCEAAQPGEDSG